MSHPLSGMHVVYQYTESDDETEAEYLVVFAVNDALVPVWQPSAMYEPSDAPCDLNDLLVNHLRTRGIEQLVSVHDPQFFDINMYKDELVLRNPNWWFRYSSLCTDDPECDLLAKQGIVVRHWMNGSFL